MTDLKISQLTDGGGLQADDELAVSRSAASYKSRGTGVDGWVSDTAETWTYASATTFTVSGVDVTAKYTPGTRIKLTQTTVKYFVVTASSFSTDTTVTITAGSDYTLANAAISANYHSYAANPQGYPGWFNYDCAPSGWSGTPTQTLSQFSVNGRVCTVGLIITGTSNSTSTSAALPIPVATGWTNMDAVMKAFDNGLDLTSPGAAELGSAGTTAITLYKDWAGNPWTASGTKLIRTVVTYRI